LALKYHAEKLLIYVKGKDTKERVNHQCSQGLFRLAHWSCPFYCFCRIPPGAGAHCSWWDAIL